MYKRFLFAVLLLIFTDGAQAAEETRASYDIKLTYKAYWAGFVISKVNSVTHIGPSEYKMDVAYEITGLATLFSNMKNEVSTRGEIGPDGRLRPLFYRNTGSWGKEGYDIQTKFSPDDGKVTAHDYSFKFKKEFRYIPIRDDLKFGPDMVTYYLGLTLDDQAMKISSEMTHQNVFGGFFLLDIGHRCTGDKILKSRRSIYKGPVRICEFKDEIIGGNFEKVKKKKKRKKKHKKKKRSELEPVPMQIWYAKLDELKALNPWVPVYSEFAIDWGKVHVYLSKIEVIKK